MLKSKKTSYSSEREFGVLVGGILTAISVWWIYRGKFEHLWPYFLTIGSLGMILGLIYPRLLVLPRRGWMAFAEALSFVTTRIILGLVFFLIVTPIGYIKRLTGWDPLRRRSSPEQSYWQPYPRRQQDPRHYDKMY